MKILLFAFAIFSSFFSLAQGCSDAGFCTMGAMKPDQHYSEKMDVKLRSIELNTYRGTTTLTPIVYVLTLDATFALSENVFFQAKIPYQKVVGNFGETSGVGDLSFSLTRSLGELYNGSISGTLGAKIPTNHSNLNDNSKWGLDNDLPMYYQISLGSYDLVAGSSWINEKWLFATGVQVALTDNRNDFRWGNPDNGPSWRANYKSGEGKDYVEKYALANNLRRGIDVMFRAERNVRFTNFNFNVGLLPIFRVTPDIRTDFSNDDRRIKEKGTTGLALSALAGGGYSFNVNSSVKVILGKKLLQRRVNPDGLTREFVSSVSYVYRF